MTPDIQAAIARDKRLQALTLSIDAQHELQESRPLRVVLEHLKIDAEQAMREFAEANPADTQKIMGLQARVYRATKFVDILERIRQSGQLAQESLAEDDRRRDMREQMGEE